METHQSPQAVCPRCGKEYILENVVSTGKPPLSRVCDECRAKMKKTTVTVITYEDGQREIHGDCDFCGQTPCEHCPPDVTILQESMLRQVLEPQFVDPLINRLYPRTVTELTKQYPHAARYITLQGLAQADKETLKRKLTQFLQAQVKYAYEGWKEYGPGELSPDYIKLAVDKFIEELKAEGKP